MRLVLHEADIDPRRIVCEVTEQKSASSEALHSFVQALRAHGFRIAVDDYGAHDSDIERIRVLKPDIVKFDAQWITRLMESGPGFALLHAMVANFADQGIETVFEGIEEGWQLELAERSGASMVQGYVLARPEIAPTSFAQFRQRENQTSAIRRSPRPASRPSRQAATCAGAQLRKAGVAAVIHPISSGGDTAIFVDEIGIEIGIVGEYPAARLLSADLRAPWRSAQRSRGPWLDNAVSPWAGHAAFGFP